MERYEHLIEECSRFMSEKALTIAFAESATAGKLAFEFSQTPYSGTVLKGGLVCYDACIKEDILDIPKEMIEEYTPESAEITREMALRLNKIIDADLTVSVTGLTIAGGSEEPGKPVGTMFYCILKDGTLTERKKIFSGTQREIINLTIEQIAKTIIQVLNL